MRAVYIDVAKIIGLFLVILGHLYTTEGVGAENVIRTFIYGFHMPFFFLVSGMLHKDKGVSPFKVISGNYRKLILPWLCFNVFAVIYYSLNGLKPEWGGVVHYSLQGIWVGHDTACQASWFVFVLFFIKIAFGLILNDWFRRVFTLIGFVLSVHSLTSHFYFNTIIIGFVFYSAGYEIKKLEIDKIKGRVPDACILMMGIIGLICSGLLTSINGKVSLLYCSLNNPILFYLNSLIGSMSILILDLSLEKYINKSLAAKVSIASIGVVLTHMFFVDYLRLLRSIIPVKGVALFIFYCFAATIIYGICVYLYHCLNKYMPIIFGNSKLK